MNEHAFLVQSADGRLERKSREQLGPQDELVFDGPDAFVSAKAFQAWVGAQIAAAGGLEMWRAKVQREGLPELPQSMRHLVL
jgi:hypothetical protein